MQSSPIVVEDMMWKPISELPELFVHERIDTIEVSNPIIGLMKDGFMFVVECERYNKIRTRWVTTGYLRSDMTKVIRYWCEAPDLPEDFKYG